MSTKVETVFVERTPAGDGFTRYTHTAARQTALPRDVDTVRALVLAMAHEGYTYGGVLPVGSDIYVFQRFAAEA